MDKANGALIKAMEMERPSHSFPAATPQLAPATRKTRKTARVLVREGAISKGSGRATPAACAGTFDFRRKGSADNAKESCSEMLHKLGGRQANRT